MSKTLYLECNSGISGDMFVAAMLDLGVDQQKLLDALASIPVDGFEIQISRVKKSGLDACDFSVLLDKEHENHDNDMQYLHGDGHLEHHHHHSHAHRGLPEITHMIAHTKISERAKEMADRIFDILAEAEAKAHGMPKDQVHFHEVGAIDSIVDTIAAAVCLDLLDVEEVIIPQLSEGQGFIRCQHGMIPVPVPATANIVQAHGLVLHPLGIEGEFVTPTGAAISAAIMTSKQLPASYTVDKIGIGAGKRSYERPSILRAMLICPAQMENDRIFKLETNVDDCSGEALGYVMERLFEAGARDVHYTPVYMKKNRPAVQLNVICDQEKVSELEEIIFAETTTIGIRKIEIERTVLQRDIVSFQSTLGEAAIKLCHLHTGVRAYPEYNSVIALCRKNGKSYQDVYHQVLTEWEAGMNK